MLYLPFFGQYFAEILNGCFAERQVPALPGAAPAASADSFDEWIDFPRTAEMQEIPPFATV